MRSAMKFKTELRSYLRIHTEHSKFTAFILLSTDFCVIILGTLYCLIINVIQTFLLGHLIIAIFPSRAQEGKNVTPEGMCNI